MKNNLDNILVGIIVQKPLLVHIVDEDLLRTNVENFTRKHVIIIRIVNIAHRNEYSMAKVSPLESLSYSKVHSMESSGVTVPTDNQVDSLQKLSEILHGDAKRIIKESYKEQKLFKWHVGKLYFTKLWM